MSDLITAQIKEIVGDALTQFAEDITLYYGGGLTDDGSGNWAEASASTTTAKGFMEDFNALERLGGVPDNARKIIILAQSINREPLFGEDISMRGERMNIIRVQKDPAQATYILWCKHNGDS